MEEDGLMAAPHSARYHVKETKEMYKPTLSLVIAICGLMLFALIGCDSHEEGKPISDSNISIDEESLPISDSSISIDSNGSSNQLEDVKASVSAYIKGGLASDKEAVAKVSVPGSAVLEQALTDLHEMDGISTLSLIEVHGNPQNAIAVSSPISAGPNQQGALVFSLTLDAGNWLIGDIDFKDTEAVTRDIERFKQRFSSSEKLL
jgi:hypothetical protein